MSFFQLFDTCQSTITKILLPTNRAEKLQTHPEILVDVKRETERMMNERDKTQLVRGEQVHGQSTIEKLGKNDTISAVDGEEVSVDDTTLVENAANNTATATQSSNKLTYDLREITSEVIEQIKSDFTKMVDFIVPEHRREQIRLLFRQQIQPALKSFATVAKDMGLTAYDLVRRYVMAFMNKKKGKIPELENSDSEQQKEEEQITSSPRF